MRIHIGERDRHKGVPLYQAIVEVLRARGMAGATVTQCIAGFGATRALHSHASDISALDLPVVVECVETEEHVQDVLPILDDMIGGGLITLERAEVIAYRAHHDEPAPREAP
jgi:hypothetical protein